MGPIPMFFVKHLLLHFIAKILCSNFHKKKYNTLYSLSVCLSSSPVNRPPLHCLSSCLSWWRWLPRRPCPPCPTSWAGPRESPSCSWYQHCSAWPRCAPAPPRPPSPPACSAGGTPIWAGRGRLFSVGKKAGMISMREGNLREFMVAQTIFQWQ